MPIANLNTGMKVCSRKECRHKGKPQPVTNFYPDKRSLDGLKSECSDCGSTKNMTDEERQRYNERSRKHMQEIQEQAPRNLAIARSSLLANALTRGNNASHMDAMAEALLRQAGSYQKVAEDYLRVLDDPYLKPQHKIKLYEGLFKVFAESDKQNPGRGDVSLMSDEELDERIHEVTSEILSRNASEKAIEVEFRDVTEQ